MRSDDPHAPHLALTPEQLANVLYTDRHLSRRKGKQVFKELTVTAYTAAIEVAAFGPDRDAIARLIAEKLTTATNAPLPVAKGLAGSHKWLRCTDDTGQAYLFHCRGTRCTICILATGSTVPPGPLPSPTAAPSPT